MNIVQLVTLSRFALAAFISSVFTLYILKSVNLHPCYVYKKLICFCAPIIDLPFVFKIKSIINTANGSHIYIFLSLYRAF